MKVVGLSAVRIGRKNTRCTLDRKLDGPHSWFWCYGEEKNLLALSGLDPRLLRRRTLACILCRLSYSGNSELKKKC